MNEHDEDNDIGAKPGETWVTEDGSRAYVYAIDGAGNCPILGAVITPEGKTAYQWCKNGRSSRIPTKRDPYALLRRYDWRAELAPIWAVLDPKHRWLAQDGYGRWWCYVNKPTESDSRWKYIAGSTVVRLNHLVFPEPDCPWFDTLTERPD
jgi:hypothetical protein